MYDTANWANFEKFLRNLYKKFGKVLTYMDNAPYRGKARLRALAKETGGDIQFRFLPPYTPKLNPIESPVGPDQAGPFNIHNVHCQGGMSQHQKKDTAENDFDRKSP